MNKERFWLPRKLIDEYARNLTVYELAVYVALARHANFDGTTFVGCRKIGEELGINKDTVSNAIRKLTASGMVGHYKRGRHGVYCLTVDSVRREQSQRPTGQYTSNTIKKDIKKSPRMVIKTINGRTYEFAAMSD